MQKKVRCLLKRIVPRGEPGPTGGKGRTGTGVEYGKDGGNRGEDGIEGGSGDGSKGREERGGREREERSCLRHVMIYIYIYIMCGREGDAFGQPTISASVSDARAITSRHGRDQGQELGGLDMMRASHQSAVEARQKTVGSSGGLQEQKAP